MQRVAQRLKEFADNLEAGVPIEATQVQRFETPDGPMHVMARKILNQPPPSEEDIIRGGVRFICEGD